MSREKSRGLGYANKGAKGENWKFRIYFDPEADQLAGSSYEIEHEELIEKLSKLLDASETIQEVSAHKTPLSSIPFTKYLFYHEFIVFETQKYWWSIEKQGDGITIQRSIYLEAVKSKYRQTDRRKGGSLMKCADGTQSINDLIDWLYKSDALNDAYNWFQTNCQHFAEAVYENMTKKKETLCL